MFDAGAGKCKCWSSGDSFHSRLQTCGLSSKPMDQQQTSVFSLKCLSTITFFFLIGTLNAQAPNPDLTIGSIKIATGECSLIRNNVVTTATPGQVLNLDDILVTGENGAIGVILRDDTILSLGPASRVVLDEFIFEPAEGKLSLIIKIIRGTAAYLSGKISQLSPGSAKVETPVATIGIRGTHFAVKVEESK